MGNCLFPMNLQLVKPSDLHRWSSSDDTSSNKYSTMNDHHRPNTILRIKVKMSTTEFKELMAQCDRGEGDMELGRLIVQECLKGNGTEARVVDHSIDRGGNDDDDDDEKKIMMFPLETIHEE